MSFVLTVYHHWMLFADVVDIQTPRDSCLESACQHSTSVSTAPKTTSSLLHYCYVCMQEEALAVTGQTGAQAAAQWVLNRPKSSTQWSIVKQGSSGSVLCSRQPPAVYNQSALQVWLCYASISCTAEFIALVRRLSCLLAPGVLLHFTTAC